MVDLIEDQLISRFRRTVSLRGEHLVIQGRAVVSDSSTKSELRVVTLALHAYMPETTERLMGALGQDGGFAIEAAGFGAGGVGTVTTLDPPLFPKK